MKKSYKNFKTETKNIGKRIQQVRKFFRQNQTEFASEIGKTQSHICNIESGKIFPSMEVLLMISRLGQKGEKINMHWLITGKGEIIIQETSDKQGLNNEIFNKIVNLDIKKKIAILGVLDSFQ